MTQAFNLSQLANNLNTSGQLDATDGLSGTVPLANGGTGTTNTVNTVVAGSGISISTSGTQVTVSTSGGGGVTSLNGQTGAITNTDYGAIGSYITAFDGSVTGSSAVMSAGRTTAGSNLRKTSNPPSVAGPTSINGDGSLRTNAVTTLGLSGTWRQMTNAQNNTDTGTYGVFYPISLFVRIS